jgi:hypothetical protein
MSLVNVMYGRAKGIHDETKYNRFPCQICKSSHLSLKPGLVTCPNFVTPKLEKCALYPGKLYCICVTESALGKLYHRICLGKTVSQDLPWESCITGSAFGKLYHRICLGKAVSQDLPLENCITGSALGKLYHRICLGKTVLHLYHIHYMKLGVPVGQYTRYNFPQKGRASVSGYTLTEDLPGTNKFLETGNIWELPSPKMYWLLGRGLKLSTSNRLHMYKMSPKPIRTYGMQL